MRERSHWNIANIKAQDPVGLGLCSRVELDEALRKAGYRSTMEMLAESDKAAEQAEAESEQG